MKLSRSTSSPCLIALIALLACLALAGCRPPSKIVGLWEGHRVEPNALRSEIYRFRSDGTYQRTLSAGFNSSVYYGNYDYDEKTGQLTMHEKKGNVQGVEMPLGDDRNIKYQLTWANDNEFTYSNAGGISMTLKRNTSVSN